jgi:hypothetical protein
LIFLPSKSVYIERHECKHGNGFGRRRGNGLSFWENPVTFDKRDFSCLGGPLKLLAPEPLSFSAVSFLYPGNIIFSPNYIISWF